MGSKTLFSPVEQRARRFLPCTDFHLCGFDQQQYSKTIEQFNMKGSRGIIDVRGGSNVHRGAGMRTPHSAVYHPLEKSSTTLKNLHNHTCSAFRLAELLLLACVDLLKRV